MKRPFLYKLPQKAKKANKGKSFTQNLHKIFSPFSLYETPHTTYFLSEITITVVYNAYKFSFILTSTLKKTIEIHVSV